MIVQEKSLKSPTIYDVAKLAGVSPMTVSRAFSRKLPVSEGTRQKILKVANRLQFRPSPLARGLNGGRTHCISVLWSQILPVLPQEVLNNLTSSAREKQFCLQLVIFGDNINEILKETLLRAIDAVILCAPLKHLSLESFALLRRFHASVLIVDSPVSSDSDQIIWGRSPAIRDAVAYLKSCGRQKLCMFMNVAENKLKVDAFFNAALDSGFSIDKSSIVDLSIDIASDIEKFEVFFEEYLNNIKIEYDAILFSNDEIACVAMRLLQQKGYSVPSQIAVIGFNDGAICRVVHPKLASVNRNHEILARQMEDVIFTRLENPSIAPQLRKVDMIFVPRESALGKIEGRLP